MLFIAYLYYEQIKYNIMHTVAYLIYFRLALDLVTKSKGDTCRLHGKVKVTGY